MTPVSCISKVPLLLTPNLCIIPHLNLCLIPVFSLHVHHLAMLPSVRVCALNQLIEFGSSEGFKHGLQVVHCTNQLLQSGCFKGFGRVCKVHKEQEANIVEILD